MCLFANRGWYTHTAAAINISEWIGDSIARIRNLGEVERGEGARKK